MHQSTVDAAGLDSLELDSDFESEEPESELFDSLAPSPEEPAPLPPFFFFP